MAYVRRTWQERAGTLLNRFLKSSETSTSVVLVNDPDTITQAGTPFTAAAMNNIEDGIVEALAKVPTGVNNNVLLSDGAGKAKDSGKALGYANMLDVVVIASGNFAGNAGVDGRLNTKYFVDGAACNAEYPGSCPPGSGFLYAEKSIWVGNDPNYCRIYAHATSDGRSWEIIKTDGTFGSWTPLTDASGNTINAINAINANSLGGVAAAFYTGFIGNGTPLQNGMMANDTYVTANDTGWVRIGITGGGICSMYIGAVQAFYTTVAGTWVMTFPVKAGQQFKVWSNSFTSATFVINPKLS